MKIYEYAAVFNPNDSEKKEGEKSTIVISPKQVLCENERAALMLAARDIPDSFLDKMDRVEVAVRPF